MRASTSSQTTASAGAPLRVLDGALGVLGDLRVDLVQRDRARPRRCRAPSGRRSRRSRPRARRRRGSRRRRGRARRRRGGRRCRPTRSPRAARARGRSCRRARRSAGGSRGGGYPCKIGCRPRGVPRARAELGLAARRPALIPSDPDVACRTHVPPRRHAARTSARSASWCGVPWIRHSSSPRWVRQRSTPWLRGRRLPGRLRLAARGWPPPPPHTRTADGSPVAARAPRRNRPPARPGLPHAGSSPGAKAGLTRRTAPGLGGRERRPAWRLPRGAGLQRLSGRPSPGGPSAVWGISGAWGGARRRAPAEQAAVRAACRPSADEIGSRAPGQRRGGTNRAPRADSPGWRRDESGTARRLPARRDEPGGRADYRRDGTNRAARADYRRDGTNRAARADYTARPRRPAARQVLNGASKAVWGAAAPIAAVAIERAKPRGAYDKGVRLAAGGRRVSPDAPHGSMRRHSSHPASMSRVSS